MGRLVTYMTILIVLDLMFIITGQLCSSPNTCTFTSAIFGQIINPSSATFSSWFSAIIGNVGALLNGNSSQGALGQVISTLFAVGGVAAVALFGLKNESVLWSPLGFTLSLLAGDFVMIYNLLASGSTILAALLMSPIIVIYTFTIVEWVRGMP